MGKTLVIVESPAKAKTINKYLGNDYKVLASMGHIRDLPTNKLGVNIKDEFAPDYIVMPSKRKVISELKEEAKKADQIFLASDPDREGEAICWHIRESIIPPDKPVFRVMFNEITKTAIQAAISNPGAVNMNLVEAQQARRILDRLVGYQISPVLWKKVKRGISAGRVQSVALRMIVDREYEILNFNIQEYWTFAASLEGAKKPVFEARLTRWENELLRQGNKEAKRTIANAAEADLIEAELKAATPVIKTVKRKAKKQSAPPPFTTSKLQQEASRALSFTVKKTMMIAQRLYEGVEIQGEPVGLITYMRTDSTRVGDEAIGQVRQFITEQYAPGYLPEKPNVYKQKSNIQDGHEAIRPTRADYTPDSIKDSLSKDELRLYTLIWKRFVASQMNPKLMDETTIEIEAAAGILEAKGIVTTFPGFSALYTEKPNTEGEEQEATVELPDLEQGETLTVHQWIKKQNNTKPPSRFTEASLVKALEENGIGRPSTYATIISTIQNRDYVEKREQRFHPSELGMVVIDLLTKSFPDLMDMHYTASMETQLDEVEQGIRTWRDLLGSFYSSFETSLQQAEENMPNLKRDGMHTDIVCEICGAESVIKSGKYGHFLSCSKYPECTFAKKIKDIDPTKTEMAVIRAMVGKEQEGPEVINEPCPECGGSLVRRRGKFGEFIACGNYPDCRYIHRELTGVACPKPDCNGSIQVRKSKKGRVFFGCTNYPTCDYVSWDKPTGTPCPDCEAPTLFEKTRKKELIHYCATEGCKYVSEVDEEAPATAEA